MPTRRRALIAALAAWTTFLWVQRLLNAWGGDTETTAAKLTSTALAGVFLAFVAASVWVLVRFRGAPLDRVATGVLVAFAGWTTAVWVVRMTLIVAADHSVGFKVVHAGLGLVSIALAWAVARPLVRGWSAEPVAG